MLVITEIELRKKKELMASCCPEILIVVRHVKSRYIKLVVTNNFGIHYILYLI